MEETSANSPSPFLACQTNPCSVPAILESVNSLAATELSDAHSFSEINSTMLPCNEFSTPKKRQCFSVDGSLYKPVCDETLKPAVGMQFDDIAAVEAFYKKYAHHVGFGVRLGAQRDVVYDDEGNALEDNPINCVDMDTRRKILDAWNKLEDIIRRAKKSSGGLDLLNRGLCNLESAILQSAPVASQTTEEGQESFVGSTIPTQVDIPTPTNVNARGICSRIKGHRDNDKKAGSKKIKLGVTVWVPHTCSLCQEVVLHDARTCHKKK